MINENILEKFDSGIIGGIDDGMYHLFECNQFHLDMGVIDIIYELRIRGVIPVIAHPERYSYVLDNIRILDSLIKEGCLFQLDIGSLNGDFGNRTKKCAKKLLELDVYNFVGSDAHDSKMRSTRMNVIIDKQKRKMRERLKILIKNNEAMINKKRIVVGKTHKK